MAPLTRWNKVVAAAVTLAAGVLAVKTYGPALGMRIAPLRDNRTGQPAGAMSPAVTVTERRPASSLRMAPELPPAPTPSKRKPVRIGLSQWPGHLPFVVGAGGLRTQPGSIAAEEDLELEIVFIESAASKNNALRQGAVDFVWQTVDELPITLGGEKQVDVSVRAMLQLDWSRGGDACVASEAVQYPEDLVGRRAAMLRFSPDHTVFEFMISNSRLSSEQLAAVRADILFSDDDHTYARQLFVDGKVDVACLWEPDVSLALAQRPGTRRLFSTKDASELVADVLLARPEYLEAQPEVAEKVAKVWFRAVERVEADRAAAAKLIARTCSRFREEMGEQATLASLGWVRWATLRDNVRFFGLDGAQAPAFDRVYNQADSVWVQYPDAQIKVRFPPAVVRNERAVRTIWEERGRPPAFAPALPDHEATAAAAPLFSRPVSLPFAANSAELEASAIAVINRDVIPQVQMAGSMAIRIEGNTDAIGAEAYNRTLSALRAQAVMKYLISRGIPAERLQARGNGSARPIASNDTPQGRARNRRTDVLFIPLS